MMNDNMQHLGFAPQIPTLTPAEMRNQSTLDRLTAFLRSLVLIPGEGINVRRDGSSGTVVEASVNQQISTTSRKPSFWYDAATSQYVVDIPRLTFSWQYPQANRSTITKRQWRFTGDFPSEIYIIHVGNLVLNVVHTSTTGADATTTDDYISSIGGVDGFNWKSGSGTNGVYEAPEFIIPLYRTKWYYTFARAARTVSLNCASTGNGQWTTPTGVASSGVVNYPTNQLTLTANAISTILLEVPEDWFYILCTGNPITLAIRFYDNIGTTDQRQTGFIYFSLGTITCTGQIIEMQEISQPTVFNLPPLQKDSPSQAYVKTVTPLAFGTVSGQRGLLRSTT